MVNFSVPCATTINCWTKVFFTFILFYLNGLKDERFYFWLKILSSKFLIDIKMFYWNHFDKVCKSMK